MSEVRLVVREAERDWSGTIHGSCADCAVAALSADPVTLDEMEQAVARFHPWRSSGGRYFCNLRPGSCDEPYDAGLVVIDLVAWLVVVDSTYSSPGECGTIWRRDEKFRGQKLAASGRVAVIVLSGKYATMHDVAISFRFWDAGLTWMAFDFRRRIIFFRVPNLLFGPRGDVGDQLA